MAIEKQKTFIVGIGASAGGLEALKAFFSALPMDSGLSFVVVTHQEPGVKNPLSDILRKNTSVPVVEISEDADILPDQIHICPTSHYTRIHEGKLVCEQAPEQRAVLPIDYFLRSLAEVAQEKAAAIIFSGAGSDGTLGIQAIKGNGGMVMAQSLNSAEFSSMPGNAVATGLVDYVLAPKLMPAQLLQYVRGYAIGDDTHDNPPLSDAVEEILAILRQHTGNDFTHYKRNTLSRRIERRMNVHHIMDTKHYVRYLQENAHEVELLFKETLIGVTAFFRDPSVYELLELQGLPELLESKRNGEGVRIWIAGCSTGEEAYSLAILLQEYMEATRKMLDVSIFATDLDDKAISHARNGLYTDGIALDVSPERLQRYFTREDSHYRVKKSIREMIVFATQNLVQDPPFTQLDMISCRNLLIYLDNHLQKKIIPLFHYALKPQGLLLLGSSETIGAFQDLFTTTHNRWKIFTRKEMPLNASRLSRFMESPRIDAGARVVRHVLPQQHKASDISQLANEVLLRQYVPPSLIVNERGDVFFIHGRTGMYLEPPAGPPSPQQNALAMAREGLPLALTAAIRKAAMQDDAVIQKNVEVRTNGHFTRVNLRAHKIAEPEALRGLIWVAFEEAESEELPKLEKRQTKKTQKAAYTADNEQLEQELQFIKQNLQNTIEELETSNEELTSTNEELQSANEELQSANEELETSKEEMQSLNEELQTVNAELETKIGDVSYANDDMKNLLNSTGIATIFLDNNLNIKRFTNQAKKIIHLIQSDIGRPISDIVSQLEYTNLMLDAKEVLQNLAFKEKELRSRDAYWYQMRIMPYRTAENVIDGLVITFVDITRLKKSEILHAAQNTMLEMTFKGSEQNKTLEELLRTFERHANNSWFSISIYDEEHKVLRHSAAPNLPDDFNRALDGIKVGARASEPCAQAVYQRKPVVIADIAGDVHNTDFHRIALKYDLKACWAMPIMMGEKPLGSFTVYYREAHQPSVVEEELLEQAVSLVGMAISRQPTEQAA